MNAQEERKQDCPHVFSQLLTVLSWAYVYPDVVYFGMQILCAKMIGDNKEKRGDKTKIVNITKK